MIVLAPLALFIIPYFLYTDYRDKKKDQKRKAEREAKEKMELVRKVAAIAAFKSATPAEADYAAMGNRLHKLAKEKNYNVFLNCLDKIHVPTGAKLLVEECSESGLGDESKVIIELPNGEHYNDIAMFKLMRIEKSCMGAWQAYLLHKLWHVLPLFWHANYDARDYIFSKEDVNSIQPFNEEDKADIIKHIAGFNFTPEVRQNGDKFYISSCYWSDFGGLIREYIELTFDGNKIADIFQFDSKSLYNYNCGIFF